jgi:hypothetical protein
VSTGIYLWGERWIAIVGLLTLAGLAACSAVPPTAPDVVVLQWMQAFAAQDGTTLGKLTCRASQSDVQNTRLLTAALGVSPPSFGGAGGGGQFFGGGGGGQPVYDVSDLRYQTMFADDKSARVQVTGSLRMASGLASQIVRTNGIVGLTREQEQWRVCDPPAV